MFLDIFRTLHIWLRPSLVALFSPRISFHIRWCTLLLQPVTLITYTINTLPYLFSRPFTIQYIPVTPTISLRALIFKAPDPLASRRGRIHKLRPLHVEIHGGSFIGGLAESNAAFDERVARETGAVVVSLTYRFAPEYTFPTAIDDVDAALRYLRENAETEWGADPELMTVGGFSAGGNLALAAAQQPLCHAPSPAAFKAAVTFYAAIDLRLRPEQKPKPPGFPEKDPLSVLFPLFDAYASSARASHLTDSRLNPALAKRETLPARILLVIPELDILVAEQLAFAERVNSEDEREGKKGRVEVMMEPKGFHGYLELPDAVVGREVKQRAFTRGVEFLKETYALFGWSWEQ